MLPGGARDPADARRSAWAISHANDLAVLAYEKGDLAAAQRWKTAALEVPERRNTRTAAEVLDALGGIALAVDDIEQAADRCRQSLALYAEIGVTGDDAQPLIGLALVAYGTGHPLTAAPSRGPSATCARALAASARSTRTATRRC